MPKATSATGINFRFNVDDGYKKFKQFINILHKGGIHHAAKSTAWDYAKKLRDEIKKEYRSNAYSIKATTVHTYQDPPRAKNGGTIADAGRNVWSGTSSMYRSGVLSRSVTIYKNKDRTGYEVRIQKDKIYGAAGDPRDRERGYKLTWLAEQLENPKDFTFKVTQRQLNYFKAIGHPMPWKVGQDVAVKPRPKKIWEPVHRRAKAQHSAWISKTLNRKIGEIAKTGKIGKTGK